MDANGSRFHLLLGQTDWGACLREDADGTLTPLAEDWHEQSAGKLAELGWDSAQQALMLPALIFHLRDAPREGDLDPAKRRGADADAHGHIYWLEDDGVHVQNAGDGKSGRIWPVEPTTCEIPSSFRRTPESSSSAVVDSGVRRNDDISSNCSSSVFHATGEPTQPDLRGLAVLPSGHLVAGLCEPPGLLVFDLHIGGAPRRLLWPVPPAGTPAFRPVDLAARADGGLWVLDAGPGHCRIWSLNAQLDWLPLHDHAPTGEAFADFSLPLAAKQAVALTATDDAAWVLDNHLKRGACGLWRVSTQSTPTRLETHALIDLLEDDAQAGFQLAGHDLLALPDGKLLLVSQDGNQAFAFQPAQHKGQWVLDALPEYRPLRRYTPRGLALAKNRPSYSSQGHWIPLVEQARPRHETRFVVLTPGEHSTSLPAFDGGQPDCLWHRLFLDACVPPGCAFEVESRAAEHPSELALVPWKREPNPYRRGAGSELPWLPGPERANAGTWESLLQNTRGRYLQLRLTLLGNGRATPRINALRVYYPRFSWLEHYLPAAWRRDPVSAAFVERWLANPEGLFTALEDRLAAVHCLFDARSVPAETLDWLGPWFGLALTDGWSHQRKRLLLRHADQLFRERGTPNGLLRALRLAVDPDESLDDRLFSGVPDGGPWGIRLIEHFLLGADAWPEDWDNDAYRAFLVRRYGHIEKLVQAWKLEANPPADFAQAASAELAEGAADADRMLFEKAIQPARRRAHRFSVLLPRQDCDPALNDKVRQVLAREAPAHTVYEVAEYELALRIGSARLGVDSVLGAQTGWTPLIIDQSSLGLSWLTPPPAAGCWPADRFPITS